MKLQKLLVLISDVPRSKDYETKTETQKSFDTKTETGDFSKLLLGNRDRDQFWKILQTLKMLLAIGHSYSLQFLQCTCIQSRSTPTSGPPPKVSARAPAHRSYHFRGVKLKSCIKKIHHNLYISKQANVRIKHADTEGASHKKFGTDARVQ